MELDQISATLEWWSDALVDNDLHEDEHDDILSLLQWTAPTPTDSSQSGIVIVRQGPLAEDWLTYKDTICELYEKRGRNLKLREVQEIMENSYGFVATKKQYKDRFSQWRVRKNERRQTLTGKGLTRRTRRRSSLSTHTDSTVDTETIVDSTMVVALPSNSHAMLKGQRTLAALAYYLEERLFQGNVHLFFGPLGRWRRPGTMQPVVLCHPAQLNQSYSRAMVLTRNKCPRPALALFSHTSDVMENLFVTHHPALTPCILDAFIENIFDTNPKSRSTMIDEAIEVSTRVLGLSHPVTELCKMLQVSLDMEEEVDHLIWFCHKFCKVFTNRLGAQDKISAYVNLRYFEKLLQMQRHDLAQEHLQNVVDPAFAPYLLNNLVPSGMEAACLCYLRRKAHVLRALGKCDEARDTLRQSIGLLGRWLNNLTSSIVGNPIVEEAFRMLDEYSKLQHEAGDFLSGINTHAFALEICIAVRGKNDGKTMRMVSAQAKLYERARMFLQEAALRMRFPEVFGEADLELKHTTIHKLLCENCGNGQDTQNFCESHRQLPGTSTEDTMRIRWIKQRLTALY